MQKCSHTIGPPLKCIFPVSNYYKETEMDDKKDVLILSALKAIAGFVNDYFENINIWVFAKKSIWKTELGCRSLLSSNLYVAHILILINYFNYNYKHSHKIVMCACDY